MSYQMAEGFITKGATLMVKLINMEYDYGDLEIEKIMREPPKSIYLTQDELLILSLPTYSEIKYQQVNNNI